MSKIGKKPLLIPEGVKIENMESYLVISGPLGDLKFNYPREIFRIEQEGKTLKIFPIVEIDKRVKTLWGTLRNVLNNKLIGVSKGFKKTLILQGLGYNAEIKGTKIMFKLGFSRPLELEIPEGIKIEIKSERGKVMIGVWGIDKEEVGNFAAKIKALKPADRYHLKGFLYEGEFISTKPVKKLGK